jgi:hypothetical protein
MAEQDSAGAIAALLTDFSTKIRDLEERHNLLKEKVLLLGQSFLKDGDRINKELSLMKSDMRDLKIDVERMKDGIQHIVSETADFARKEELAVLEKYMKVWEPLKFVREEDVEKIIEEKLIKMAEKEK